MSTFEVIDGIQKQTNCTVLKENTSIVQHQQIEKKLITTVSNSLTSITAAATISTSRIATSSSTSFGKVKTESVASSLCMSLERKDSIHYLSVGKKGLNTVIHLDNSEFMAKRVTSVKATTTKSEILNKGQKKVFRSEATKTNNPIAIEATNVDINLKVLLGGISSYCANKQTQAMHKQKLSAKNKSRIKGGNNTLKIELPKSVEKTTNIGDLKKIKSDLPIVKKTKINSMRKRATNKQIVKAKPKGNNLNNQKINSEEVNQTLTKHFSRLTQTEKEWKILKPCCSVMQNKKCATELACPYLHSDFPCKYYYLNLPCPQGRKCQFMHNGPLDPRLLEALRMHILDLLSNKSSCAEIFFVEQTRQIDDIFERLLSFKKRQQQEGDEIIEVLDDCDGDEILNADSGPNASIDNASTKTLINYSLKPWQNGQESLAPYTSHQDLDHHYESLKTTNQLLEQYDQKLKHLKNTSNLTTNEKIIELQKIYELLLREQEKLLPIYENVNSSNITTNISPNVDNKKIVKEMETNDPTIQFNDPNEDTNFVFLNPNTVNEIQTIEYQEGILDDDETSPHKSTLNTESSLHFQSDNINPTGLNDSHMTSVHNEIESISNEINKNFKTEIEKLDNSNNFSALNKENVSDSEDIVEILNKDEFSDSNGRTKEDELYLENNIYSLNEVNKDEKEVIENTNLSNEENEDEISPSYDKYPALNKKPLRQSRIRLRSHIHQDFDEQSSSLNATEIQEQPTKVKRRRLRLPKPNFKAVQKSQSDYEINADIINKLIESRDYSDSKNSEIAISLENKDVPLTQNVILSQRFIKRAKAKLEQNTDKNEFHKNTHNCNLDTKNVEQNIHDLHNEDNFLKINSQTSDVSLHSLDPSQDSLVIDSDADNDFLQPTYEMPISSDVSRTLLNTEKDLEKSSIPFKQVLERNNEKIKNENLKCCATLESTNSYLTSHTSSSSPLEIKQKFKLGNPHVILPKLKRSVLKKVEQKEIPADSNGTAQKRRSVSTEYDSDSFPKMNKCLKISNSKDLRLANIEQSLVFDNNTEENLPFETEINPTIAVNESQQDFKLCTTQVRDTLKNRELHYNAVEYESDLYQQEIGNVCNNSDLQRQSEKQKEEQNMLQHKEVKAETATSCSEYEELKEDAKSSKEESNNQIENTCNSCENVEEIADEFEKAPTSPKENLSSAHAKSNALHSENEERVEFSKYASLYNKLASNTSKRQINFENSSVNITQIASPTYGDDAIASPSPVKDEIYFHSCGEIDGRLTYPPIPYVLYEIDLEKIDLNRPLSIDRLEKTISLDPRIFRTSIKKQTLTFHKPIAPKALAPVQKKTDTTATSMLLPYDPRIRSSVVEMTNESRSSLTNQSRLDTYNINQTTLPYINTDMNSSVNAVSLPFDYHTSQTVYPQVQQQQTPNMFLYGCLQRSPWYQSLMSTMKIQINQSISQLIRALNNFHRERLLNPTIVFDVFKIDCAGEILEIMRNLDIFIDSNGMISEKRHVPSFAGRSCNAMPVNATYSFIQQVLTPNTNCTSMTTASSSSGAMGTLNIMEPFVSCYIKAPDSMQNLPCDRSMHNNCGCNCKKVEQVDNNTRYNQNDRHHNKFKKPYDNNNNSNSNSNNYNNKRSNQRSYNSNNPRFTKSSEYENRSSSSPPNTSRDSNNYDTKNNSYSGGGGGGGRGRGGRFNNNRRFNNNNNNTNNNTSSSWFSTNSSEGDNDFSEKYQNNQSSNSSPTKFSPIAPSQQRNESSRGSPIRTSPTKNAANMDEEECWD